MSTDAERGLRILFLGDIVAVDARQAVIRCAPLLREALSLDVFCANAENAAHGFGLTPKIAEALLESGLDLLTTGNHVWDQPVLIDYLYENPTAPILRPLNFDDIEGESLPGRGFADLSLAEGKRVRIVNVIGRLFLDSAQHPWAGLDPVLPRGAPKADGLDALLIDFHAEASGEKASLGYLCDGRATALLGSHTHVPSADCRILPRGTAFQTDLGMCGVYDSVIGMDRIGALGRYLKRLPRAKLEPARGTPCICGAFLETDARTGYAKRIEPVCISRGTLEFRLPAEAAHAKEDLQQLLSAPRVALQR